MWSWPIATSASPSPQPTSRMRFPALGFSVSARNSVNSSSHHASRRCLSVGDVRASIATVMSTTDYRRREITRVETLVRNSQFARDDRTSARQQPSSSHVPNRREDPDEHDQLYPVAETRLRQDLPEEPQDRMSARNRPNGTVEVPPLVSFSLGRRSDARQ